MVRVPFCSFKIRFVSLAGQIPSPSEEFPLEHYAVFSLTCGSSVISPLLSCHLISWFGDFSVAACLNSLTFSFLYQLSFPAVNLPYLTQSLIIL